MNSPVISDFKGNKELLNMPIVSVVGTRKPTEEGIELAKSFVRYLVEKDFVVMSGLAKGIDTAAHTETLRLGGKTIAVIGTSLDNIYPYENIKLSKEIIKTGLLLTTSKPNDTKGGHIFHRRNRFMSHNSLASIVVETKERSGTISLIIESLRIKKPIIFSKIQEDKGFSWVNSFINEGAKVVYLKKDLTNILENL